MPLKPIRTDSQLDLTKSPTPDNSTTEKHGAETSFLDISLLRAITELIDTVKSLSTTLREIIPDKNTLEKTVSPLSPQGLPAATPAATNINNALQESPKQEKKPEKEAEASFIGNLSSIFEGFKNLITPKHTENSTATKVDYSTINQEKAGALDLLKGNSTTGPQNLNVPAPNITQNLPNLSNPATTSSETAAGGSGGITGALPVIAAVGQLGKQIQGMFENTGIPGAKFAGKMFTDPFGIGKATGIMAEGGHTTASQFIVGDRKDGQPSGTEELVRNPTNAPIEVVPNDKLTGTQSVPGFALGTDLKEVLAGLPRFASGTMEGAIGATISSGGMGISGNTVVETAGAAIIAVASKIPVIGDLLGEITADLTKFGTVIVDIVQGYNALAMKIAPYSGDISQAKAAVQVAGIKQDINTAQEMGPQLARLYESSNMIWLDIQKILISVSQPFLEVLVPFTEWLEKTLTDVVPTIQYGMDYVVAFVRAIMGILNGDNRDDIINGVAEAIERAENRSKQSKEHAPFTSDLYNSMRAAANAGGTF